MYEGPPHSTGSTIHQSGSSRLPTGPGEQLPFRTLPPPPPSAEPQAVGKENRGEGGIGSLIEDTLSWMPVYPHAWG